LQAKTNGQVTATVLLFVNNCAKSAISFNGTSEISLTFETGSESSAEKQKTAFDNVEARMQKALAIVGEIVVPMTYTGKTSGVQIIENNFIQMSKDCSGCPILDFRLVTRSGATYSHSSISINA
jgi:hypothetical protein